MENFLEIKNLHVKYKTLDGEKTVLAIEQPKGYYFWIGRRKWLR